MLDVIKRVASRKRTWVIIAGIATAVAQGVTGDAMHAAQTLIQTLAGN